MICSHDTSGSVQPGIAAAPASIRQWMELSLSGDFVHVDPLPTPPHPHAPLFLQSVDIYASFWKKGFVNAVPYDVDEMVQRILAAYSGLVLAPGSILTMDFKGDKLKLVVSSMSLVELPDANLGRNAGIEMGVLMQTTDVTILKEGESLMRLKSSAKKYAYHSRGVDGDL